MSGNQHATRKGSQFQTLTNEGIGGKVGEYVFPLIGEFYESEGFIINRILTSI